MISGNVIDLNFPSGENWLNTNEDRSRHFSILSVTLRIGPVRPLSPLSSISSY